VDFLLIPDRNWKFCRAICSCISTLNDTHIDKSPKPFLRILGPLKVQMLAWTFSWSSTTPSPQKSVLATHEVEGLDLDSIQIVSYFHFQSKNEPNTAGHNWQYLTHIYRVNWVIHAARNYFLRFKLEATEAFHVLLLNADNQSLKASTSLRNSVPISILRPARIKWDRKTRDAASYS
jgi:hypothetical protein